MVAPIAPAAHARIISLGLDPYESQKIEPGNVRVMAENLSEHCDAVIGRCDEYSDAEPDIYTFAVDRMVNEYNRKYPQYGHGDTFDLNYFTTEPVFTQGYAAFKVSNPNLGDIRRREKAIEEYMTRFEDEVIPAMSGTCVDRGQLIDRYAVCRVELAYLRIWRKHMEMQKVKSFYENKKRALDTILRKNDVDIPLELANLVALQGFIVRYEQGNTLNSILGVLDEREEREMRDVELEQKPLDMIVENLNIDDADPVPPNLTGLDKLKNKLKSAGAGLALVGGSVLLSGWLSTKMKAIVDGTKNIAKKSVQVGTHLVSGAVKTVVNTAVGLVKGVPEGWNYFMSNTKPLTGVTFSQGLWNMGENTGRFVAGLVSAATVGPLIVGGKALLIGDVDLSSSPSTPNDWTRFSSANTGLAGVAQGIWRDLTSTPTPTSAPAPAPAPASTSNPSVGSSSETAEKLEDWLGNMRETLDGLIDGGVSASTWLFAFGNMIEWKDAAVELRDYLKAVMDGSERFSLRVFVKKTEKISVDDFVRMGLWDKLPRPVKMAMNARDVYQQFQGRFGYKAQLRKVDTEAIETLHVENKKNLGAMILKVAGTSNPPDSSDITAVDNFLDALRGGIAPLPNEILGLTGTRGLTTLNTGKQKILSQFLCEHYELTSLDFATLKSMLEKSLIIFQALIKSADFKRQSRAEKDYIVRMVQLIHMLKGDRHVTYANRHLTVVNPGNWLPLISLTNVVLPPAPAPAPAPAQAQAGGTP